VIVYGRQPVRELLAARRRPVTRVWATPAAAREPWLADLRVEQADAGAIAARAGSDAHQGVCADTAGYPYVGAAELLGAADAFLVALDEVQDPQNLGAIARTAECAGVTGLILPERRSAEVTPAACKASAGAVEHLPVAQTRNLADFLAQAKRAGLWCYGADQGGPADYLSTDLSGPVVLVLGSEGRGLRPRVAAACDAIVSIPLRGRIESLSVSAAAAVLIFAAAAHRQGILPRT
jgi:23S rRNA (guanosine2251-2'-O)-methyltransferase